VSPSGAATNGNNAVPARDDKPVPSALTFTVLTLERPITFKVNLLSRGISASQPRSSLLRRMFQTLHAPQPHALPTNRGQAAANQSLMSCRA
jgi:hypothetical protein